MQPLTSHSAIKRIIAAGVAGLAAIATLAGGLAATTQVQADESEPAAGTIVVSGAEKGLTVSAYKIISGPYATDPQWTWNQTLAQKIAESTNYRGYVKGVSVDDETGHVTVTDPAPVDSSFGGLSSDTNGTGETAEFYDWLAAKIKQNNLTPATTENTGGETGTTLDVNDSGDGAYLVVLEDGVSVYKPSVVTVSTGTGGKGAQIVVKSTDPDIDKTTPTDSVQKGDTVPFTITTDVPTYPANAIDTKYVIGDKPSYGLDVDTNTIEVYLGTDTGEVDDNGKPIIDWSVTPLEDTQYSLTGIAAVEPTDPSNPNADGNGKGFTLDFTNHYDTIKGYKIKVEYKAEVTRVVEAGPNNGVSNGATLEYRNDPYTENGYNTITPPIDPDCDPETEDCGGPHITRYAYGFNATKVGFDDLDVGLAGAEFKLYKYNSNNSKYDILVNVYEVTEDTEGVYIAATDREDAEPATITSGTNGTLKITGLHLGKYQLKETVAPDGKYTLIDSEFELKDTNKDGTLDVSGNTSTDNPDTDGIFEYGNIVDPEKFSLATTGAAGIALMVLAALAVVGASTTLIVRRRADRKA